MSAQEHGANDATPGQAALQAGEIVYLYHWRFASGEEFGLFRHAADADAMAAKHAGEGLSEVISMAVLDRPQPAPGPLRTAWEPLAAGERTPAFEMGLAFERARAMGEPLGACWEAAYQAAREHWTRQAAPELAALAQESIRLAAANRMLRELLGEVGVMAANAPEDGDSFAVCEEIAMRVAAAGVPDSAAAPDLNAFPWRQGRSQGRNLYARTGGDDWKADVMIGQLNTPELAAGAVRAHNAAMENL